MNDAIMGTFVSIKTMADGTPRLTLDLQCGLAEVAAMGLIPGVPFAIARLEKEAASKPVPQPAKPEPKERPGQLCLMACTFCADPAFWKWVSRIFSRECFDEEDAKEFILDECCIQSRKELDQCPDAANQFHEIIRKPFLAWRDAQ